MLTSAFWHGVSGGYYLSMGLTVPVLLILEDTYEKKVRNHLSPKVNSNKSYKTNSIEIAKK